MKFEIEYPKIRKGRFTNNVVSLNNWGLLHHYQRLEIKREIKDAVRLKIGRAKSSSYRLFIVVEVIRGCSRRLNAINTAPIIKVVEDTLQEMGWVKDDFKDDILILYTKVDRELPYDEIRFEVYPLQKGDRVVWSIERNGTL